MTVKKFHKVCAFQSKINSEKHSFLKIAVHINIILILILISINDPSGFQICVTSLISILSFAVIKCWSKKMTAQNLQNLCLFLLELIWYVQVSISF